MGCRNEMVLFWGILLTLVPFNFHEFHKFHFHYSYDTSSWLQFNTNLFIIAFLVRISTPHVICIILHVNHSFDQIGKVPVLTSKTIVYWNALLTRFTQQCFQNNVLTYFLSFSCSTVPNQGTWIWLPWLAEYFTTETFGSLRYSTFPLITATQFN